MRKLFALAAVLAFAVSMSGCESCSLFHGEKARPYPYAPACDQCANCAPSCAPVGGCPSCDPTVGG